MVKARASNRIVSPYEHWEDLTDARFFAAMEDFERFCEESLVNDKQGTPVPFKLNEAQKLFAEIVLKAIDPIIHKIPTPSIRILVHKSRQMGITTACLKLEQFDAEQEIFHKGDPGDSMYIIISGSVNIHDGSHVFITLKTNQFFGEFSILDENVRSASASAMTAAGDKGPTSTG